MNIDTAENVLDNKVRLKMVGSRAKGNAELAFSPLLFYLQDGFRTDLSGFKRETTHLLSLGLSNLDVCFNGGLSSAVHVLAGKAGDERMSFIVHLLDHFARQKYACIYLSEREDKASLLLKLLIRNHFVQNRNSPIQTTQLIEILVNNPQFFEASLEQISRIVKFISIENDSLDDLTHLKNRVTYQKKKCELSVLIVDVADVYELYAKEMIDCLASIAHDLQIPILVSIDLSEDDYRNAVFGYETNSKIERIVDSFTLFTRNFRQNTATFDFNSPHLLKLISRSKQSLSVPSQMFLMYYPEYFYFQEA